jgi:hypothetical protein
MRKKYKLKTLDFFFFQRYNKIEQTKEEKS